MSSLYENPSCEITHGSFTPRDEDVDVDVESLSPVRTEPVATPPVSPPVRVKRMRGSIGGSLDINREKLFGQHHSRPKASAAKSSTVRSGGSRKKKSAKNDPLNWQIVVYKPLPFPLNLLRSVPEKAKKRLPKPFAIREHVPGMRIRGARVMPGKERQKDGRATGKPAMDKKPNHVEQPVDKKRKHAEPPVTILSDSESELEVRPEHVALVDHRDQAEASTSKSAVQIKKQPGNRNRTVPTTRPNYGSDMSARARVKDVLDKFDSLRRRFLREDENRAKNAEKGSGGKRADLRASSILMEKGFRVNGSESIEGPVPGVDVGDHFYYRMELLIISLHRQSQGGIDYIPSNRSKHRDKNGNPLAVAVSVIASGGYEDDKDEGDILIYTGQGGNNYKGDKRQGHDQELVRGNLALKNCCDLGLSVRVIRGYEVKKSDGTTSPSGKIYYYDGLYDVKDCYQDMGSAGYKVWKYKLIRKEGQPQLVSPLILFTRKSSPPLLFGNRGEKILLDDISKGLEPMKVRVVGLMDDPTLPESFEYIVKLKFTKGIPRLEPAKACSCSKECLETCPCLKWNRGEPPYNENGSLIRGKKAIYECGLQCHCGSECHSRVSQKGIHHNLEIFRTENRGWGVRSTNFIPQGSFICEYVGEVVHTSEAELRVSADEYLLDLNVPKNMKQRFGDLSGLFDEASDRDDENEGDEALTSCEKWTVDACQYGNVGRFINHSCDGNLFVQRVFYDHHDMRFPHVMLFAMEKISPFQELTYDYRYVVNSVEPNGQEKVLSACVVLRSAMEGCTNVDRGQL